MKSLRKFLFFSFLLLMTALLSWLLLTGFPGRVFSQTNSDPAPEMTDPAATEPAATENVDEIEVYVSFLGFDPIRGELDARFQLIPKGKYVNVDTTFLTESMRFTETFATTNQEFEVLKNRPIPSPVVKYVTYEGDANDYPFDQYSGGMSFYLESLEPDTAGEYIPFTYFVEESLPGFDIKAIVDEAYTTADYVAMDIKISRSMPVVFFSSLVMIIMWLLAIITGLMAIRILFSDRFPEIGLLGFLGALLFAFPAIRNAQPNVPPVGTLGDFLSFFWTELIVVISLIIVGVSWLRRYPTKPQA